MEDIIPNKKVMETVSNKVEMIPNPNNGEFKLYYSFANETNISLTIFDITGNEIALIPLVNNKLYYEYKNKNLANGLYFYKLTSTNKILHTGKFIISNN